eukprot:3994668-Amphidinium_carterae.1
MHSTKYVMWFVLKILQPSPDVLRIGILRDLMAQKAQDIKTYARAVEWLEIFYQKLEVAVEINVKIEGTRSPVSLGANRARCVLQ